MSDVVRCVIFTSQDENGKERVEQIPVQGSEFTIGSEQGNTFVLKGAQETLSCRIVFDKERGKITTKSSQVFVKEKATHKALPQEETQTEWEPVQAFKLLEDPTQFGIKVGSHELFVKHVKLMDVYVKKNLIVDKQKLEDICADYADKFYAAETQEKIKKVLSSGEFSEDNKEDLVYTDWKSSFDSLSKQLDERCKEKVELDFPDATKDVDEKINRRELDMSEDFPKYAKQGFAKATPKMKADIMEDLAGVSKNTNKDVFKKALGDMDLRLDPLFKNLTQIESEIQPMKDERDRQHSQWTKLQKHRKETKKELEKMNEQLQELIEQRKRKRTCSEATETRKRRKQNFQAVI